MFWISPIHPYFQSPSSVHHLPLPGLLQKSSNIFACLLLGPPSLPTNLYHCCQRDILMFLNFSRLKCKLFNLGCKALCELVPAYLSNPFYSSGLLPYSSHTGLTNTPLNVPHCFILWKLHAQSSFFDFCTPFVNLLKPPCFLKPRSCIPLSLISPLNYSFWKDFWWL